MSRSRGNQEGKLKNKTDIIPEIIIPKGYKAEEILDMSDDFGDEEPIYTEEVKVKFE